MSDIKTFEALLKPSIEKVKSADKKDAPVGGAFDATLKDALNQVNTMQKEADKAVESLASGGDVTDAVLAMEKANMSFNLMVEVRNKLLTAYEEVMRMQV